MLRQWLSSILRVDGRALEAIVDSQVLAVVYIALLPAKPKPLINLHERALSMFSFNSSVKTSLYGYSQPKEGVWQGTGGT